MEVTNILEIGKNGKVKGYKKNNPNFIPGTPLVKYSKIYSKCTMKQLKNHYTEARLVQTLEKKVTEQKQESQKISFLKSEIHLISTERDNLQKQLNNHVQMLNLNHLIMMFHQDYYLLLSKFHQRKQLS